MQLQPFTLISELLVRLPVALVWLAGIVLALRRRERAPRASAFALTGLVMLLVLSFLGALLSFMPLWMHVRTGMDMNTLSWLNLAFRVVLSVLTAAAWVLILLAIFENPAQRR